MDQDPELQNFPANGQDFVPENLQCLGKSNQQPNFNYWLLNKEMEIEGRGHASTCSFEENYILKHIFYGQGFFILYFLPAYFVQGTGGDRINA